MTSPWAPRVSEHRALIETERGSVQTASEEAEDQAERTSVRGRLRSAVAERGTGSGGGWDVTTRGAAKRPATAGRIVVGARACNACSGTPRCAVVTSAAFACWLTTLMSMTVHIFGVRHRRMSVIERARQVQGLSGRRVRRARPSEPRAGTVTPLSVRPLTGGDVGIGRDVRPSYVQVGAGARRRRSTGPRGCVVGHGIRFRSDHMRAI